MKFTHSNDVEIKTDRLLLRQFKTGDVQDMLNCWIADPLVQKEYGEPVYETEAEVGRLLDKWIKQYKEADLYRWAVILDETNTCIGQIAFCCVYEDDKTAEVEYCLGREFWGKGYASEALSAVIRHTFRNTDFDKLEAFFRNENARSEKVLINAGMKKVPNVKRFEAENIKPKGKTCYAITRKQRSTEFMSR